MSYCVDCHSQYFAYDRSQFLTAPNLHEHEMHNFEFHPVANLSRTCQFDVGQSSSDIYIYGLEPRRLRPRNVVINLRRPQASTIGRLVNGAFSIRAMPLSTYHHSWHSAKDRPTRYICESRHGQWQTPTSTAIDTCPGSWNKGFRNNANFQFALSNDTPIVARVPFYGKRSVFSSIARDQ